MKFNRFLLGVSLACLSGLVLRIYSLGFFEFKMDQAQAVIAAPYVLNRFFMIFHGMMSGVGLPNPPGFYWFMGFFAIFGESPLYFASVFLFLSCILPFCIYFLLRGKLFQETLMVVIVLVATSPMLIIFSCNIWAQCLMPMFSIFIIWSLVNFIEKGEDVFWVMAIAAAMLAGSIHLSGMFLLPVIAFVVIKKCPALKAFFYSTLAGCIIFGGWIIFLLKYWDWRLYPARFSYLDNLIYSLKNILFFPTNFFLLSYFPDDFLKVSGFYTGKISVWLLLLLGSIPIWVFFVSGAIAYLKVYPGKWRQILFFQGAVPIVFQISLLISLITPAMYLILAIRVHIFYMLVIAPAYFIVCAYGFSSIKRSSLKYSLLLFFSIAALLNSGYFLRYIDYSGGHPEEYGISYGFLREIAAEIDGISKGRAVNLKIMVNGRARKKIDPLTIKYTLSRFMNPQGIPLYMEIFWDEKGMCYTYSLSATMPETMRKMKEKR